MSIDEEIDDEWFERFYKTPLSTLSVVMLCDREFSLQPTYHVTPTLVKIYAGLEEEGFYPTRDGSFEHWARQGVLLLPVDTPFLPELLEWIRERLPDLTWVTMVEVLALHLDSLQEYRPGMFREINQKIKRVRPIAW